MSRSWIPMVCLVLALASPVHAQSPTTGAIQGRVVDAATKEPRAGVTVWASSPSQIEPQAAVTEDDGTYKISDLLPGTYTVTFFDDTTSVTQTDITVGANDIVQVFQKLGANEGDGHAVGDVIEVEGKAPQIKPSTDLSLKLDRDFLEKMPLPGRTIEAAAGTKAGAHNDGIGIAFSGSTSLENRFLVDGIDITGLTFGDVGTPVLNDFVHEIEVLSGGYNAEWGRATGGIVNVVTKSGSNRFRGSLFGTYTPGFLTRARKTTPVNASSIDIVGNRAYTADFGAELGGPILENRLWFYAGFAPQLARTDFTRITKRQTDCRTLLVTGELSACDARLQSQGGFADGAPDVDPATGFFITDEIDREVRSATSRGFSSIAKLNLAVTPKHQAQVSAILVPARTRSPGLLGLPSTGTRARTLSFDTAARWTSKLDHDKTELSAVVAWHHSELDTGAIDPALDAMPRQVLSDGNLGVWSALGGETADTVRGCTDGVLGSEDPYPNIVNCPMKSLPYVTGGPGALAHEREDRRSVLLSVTRRARWHGSHELKAGIDLDDNTKQTSRLFSGGAFLQNFVGSGVTQVTRWVALAAPGEKDARFDEACRTPDPDGGGATGGGTKMFACDFLSGTRGAPGTTIAGETIDGAAYLRDSWQPFTNLTFDAGVRYEEQRLRHAASLRDRVDPLTGNRLGKTAMTLDGNWAPRLGVIWDPTEVGESKLWASYGRFFEAIPMDINDRSFGGEVSYQQTYRTTSPELPCGSVDPAIGAPNGLGCLDTQAAPDSEQLLGSSGVLVAPGIRAQYLDEVVLGGELQLAPDMKMGLVFQRRWLGRVIEDVSTDGAQTYVIANPGEWSEDAERSLEARIAATTDPTSRGHLQDQLEMFRKIRRFDRPSRNYSAIEINLARRFSRGLFASASYTFSKTEGNFPGSVSYDNGQVDPNISSQYDLIELLANRRGRLPQDRPHSIKLDAFYVFALDEKSTNALTVGVRARAVSGIPKNALGAHYLYGPDESFLLPRGQLGRTEMETSLDVKLSYARKLRHGMVGELYADVFNLFDRQGTFDVDSTYAPAVRLAGNGAPGGTENNVNPISGGTYEDLIWAKSIDANGNPTDTPTARNPNFGRTTSRYAPTAAQVGFRLRF